VRAPAGRDWVALLPREELLPHEKHDPDHARDLAAEMEASGLWTTPLLIERQHLIILDGHHRWAAARRLGLTSVPAFLVSYGDPRLSLASWRPEERWIPRDVIACALTGRLCPMKTTRHILCPAFDAVAVRLADLRQGTGFTHPGCEQRAAPAVR
jgi:L-serine kinase (ADP)